MFGKGNGKNPKDRKQNNENSSLLNNEERNYSNNNNNNAPTTNTEIDQKELANQNGLAVLNALMNAKSVEEYDPEKIEELLKQQPINLDIMGGKFELSPMQYALVSCNGDAFDKLYDMGVDLKKNRAFDVLLTECMSTVVTNKKPDSMIALLEMFGHVLDKTHSDIKASDLFIAFDLLTTITQYCSKMQSVYKVALEESAELKNLLVTKTYDSLMEIKPDKAQLIYDIPTHARVPATALYKHLLNEVQLKGTPNEKIELLEKANESGLIKALSFDTDGQKLVKDFNTKLDLMKNQLEKLDTIDNQLKAINNPTNNNNQKNN